MMRLGDAPQTRLRNTAWGSRTPRGVRDPYGRRERQRCLDASQRRPDASRRVPEAPRRVQARPRGARTRPPTGTRRRLLWVARSDSPGTRPGCECVAIHRRVSGGSRRWIHQGGICDKIPCAFIARSGAPRLSIRQKRIINASEKVCRVSAGDINLLRTGTNPSCVLSAGDTNLPRTGTNPLRVLSAGDTNLLRTGTNPSCVLSAGDTNLPRAGTNPSRVLSARGTHL